MTIEDFSGVINGVMWSQVVLAVIFIGMRLYTRYFLLQSFGWDDMLMIVNLVRIYTFCVTAATTTY